MFRSPPKRALEGPLKATHHSRLRRLSCSLYPELVLLLLLRVVHLQTLPTCRLLFRRRFRRCQNRPQLLLHLNPLSRPIIRPQMIATRALPTHSPLSPQQPCQVAVQQQLALMQRLRATIPRALRRLASMSLTVMLVIRHRRQSWWEASLERSRQYRSSCACGGWLENECPRSAAARS